MINIISENTKKTEDIGYRLGTLLEAYDVVCLIGDLGAGKTTLTKSIAKGLEIDDYVTSPTFTVVNEYEGRVHVNHFDVYRVNDEDELLDIGFDEYIYSDSVNIIEWANLIENILPKERLTINIQSGLDSDKREIIIEGNGKRYEDIIEKLKIIMNNSR